MTLTQRHFFVKEVYRTGCKWRQLEVYRTGLKWGQKASRVWNPDVLFSGHDDKDVVRNRSSACLKFAPPSLTVGHARHARTPACHRPRSAGAVGVPCMHLPLGGGVAQTSRPCCAAVWAIARASGAANELAP